MTKVEEACAMIPEMAKQMADMSKQLAKYDGRWGTIFLIGSALWAVFVTFKGHILGLFGGDQNGN